MKTVLAVSCAVILMLTARADVYTIAKQQAKNVANGESSKQGGGQPAAPSPPQNPSSNQELQATVQNISSLRVDLETLQTNQTDLQSLNKDLAEAALGAKPSLGTIARLAEDLAAAIGGNKKLHGQEARLAQYLHAIFNSSHLSATQQQAVFDSVQNILLGGGVPDYAAAKVVKGLKKIAIATG